MLFRSATHERTLNALQLAQEQMRMELEKTNITTEAKERIADMQNKYRELHDAFTSEQSLVAKYKIMTDMEKVALDNYNLVASTMPKTGLTKEQQQALKSAELEYNQAKQEIQAMKEWLKIPTATAAAPNSDALKAAMEKNLPRVK